MARRSRGEVEWFFRGLHTTPSERPRWWQRLLALFLGVPLVGALCGVLVVAPVLWLPDAMVAASHSAHDAWEAIDDDLPPVTTPVRSRILDREGNVIATFWSEDRIELPVGDIPQVMKDAQVSIEDTRFYEHGPVDTKGLGRAALGRGGGSTITQQYVKNVLLYVATDDAGRRAATERSITRKIKEMRYAAGVESRMSKDEILAGYLNIANYGDGTYGIEAASRHYFGHPASELTVAEAATLAGIVQNPSRNPVADPRQSLDRRNYTIAMMLRAGRITDEQARVATAAPLGLKVTRTDNGCRTSTYPYFCEVVRDILRHDPAFGTPEQRSARLSRGGLTIRTTLDPRAMQVARDAAERALGDDNQFTAGVAVVEPGTGHVLGIGQNRTFDQTQVVLPNSGFQNGSTFKPVTLAAALEDGWDIRDTLSAPSNYTVGKKTFRNSSRSGAGTMTAPDALAVSSNTFFVKMQSEQTSVQRVQDTARSLGWPIPEDATGTEAATTLGVYDVSPVEVAAAYAAFAAGGTYCRPTWITGVADRDGASIPVPSPDCHNAVSPRTAALVANSLAGVVDGPNPSRTGKAMSIGRPVMGKTGTTTGNSAVWFAGGTPQFATAVWVGDPRGGFRYPVEDLRLYGRRLDAVYGSTAAGPIWHDVMTRLHEGLPVAPFATPPVHGDKPVVPDVRGMELGAARATLAGAGIRTAPASGSNQHSTVTEQSVAPGQPVPTDRTVQLTTS